MKNRLLVEYLTTYGWLIVLFAVVGIALYFLSPSPYPKTECIEGNLKIMATDWRYDENGKFTFRIGNELDKEVKIVDIDVNVLNITKKIDKEYIISPKSKSEEIIISGLPKGKLGNKINLTMKISYAIPDGISGKFSYVCSLSGRIGE